MCRLVVRFFLFIVFLSVSQLGLACDTVNVVPANTAPGSQLTLSCTVSTEVNQVAVEITSDRWNISHPMLYDDGSHGDLLEDDGVYSLAVAAPADKGQYNVIFYAVHADQSEHESMTFILNVE